MSFRYISRVMYQSGLRVLQGMKDQASKYDNTIRSLKDSACSNTSSKKARRFSAVDSAATRAAKTTDKVKQAEESFRTVMYLSCWGPN